MTRIGIDFNGFRTDLVVTEAEQESLEPLDLVCPCFWEVLRSYWQSWTLSLMELGSGYPGTRTATPPASETAPTCPYLREHSTQSTPDRTEALPPSGDVLDNLAKLERAQTLWLQAEAARRKGDWDAARDAYGRIQTLCPGSTVAQRATKQLEDLHLKTSVTSQSAPSAAAEEQAPPQSDEPRR